jgi:hypothetical protein
MHYIASKCLTTIYNTILLHTLLIILDKNRECRNSAAVAENTVTRELFILMATTTECNDVVRVTQITRDGTSSGSTDMTSIDD